jgi:hypothetical protein
MPIPAARQQPHPVIYKAALALAVALPLLVYACTLAPGLTWSHHGADGGDLITAAHTLGVPHPPGYPTYTLLAWLFTRLPWGNVAWRVNLLSSLCTAAAAAFIYRAVTRLSTARGAPVIVAALTAAWGYAFAPLVWSQALIAEVYAVAGLWTALLLERGSAELTDRSAFFLGLLFSLGLGVHLTLLFLAPLVAWAALRRRSFVLGLALGLLVWLYLPLRAGRGGLTWGQPHTWRGFWWLVSGALYRGYLFSADWGARLAAWAQTWREGLGLLGLGLAAWGALGLAGRRRGWLLATAAGLAAWNVYALGYGSADSVVYLVPAFVVACVYLGAGLADLLQRVRTPWLLCVVLLMPAWTLARNVTALDLSTDEQAEDFCRAVLLESPPQAVLWTSTDRQTFALWYCQQVEGQRPDLIVIDQGLWEFDWYRDSIQHDWQARPQCQVLRQAQTGWLNCQN